jgi:hypothetical protein
VHVIRPQPGEVERPPVAEVGEHEVVILLDRSPREHVGGAKAPPDVRSSPLSQVGTDPSGDSQESVAG